MRFVTGMLAIGLLAAWGHVAPAAAQPCEPSSCWDRVGTKAKAKPGKKTVAVKKPTKQAQEIYMRAAPY